MKQLVILSGKGGTGKTSLAAAFAHLAHDGRSHVQAVLADADVDAANLELVLRPERIETHDFTGGSVAVIDQERCQGCGICEQVCRFDAVQSTPDGYRVDPIACDGCAACVYQCPEDAIHMDPQTAGQWYLSREPLRTSVPCRSLSGSGKLWQVGDSCQAKCPTAGSGYEQPGCDRGWSTGHRLPGNCRVCWG